MNATSRQIVPSDLSTDQLGPIGFATRPPGMATPHSSTRNCPVCLESLLPDVNLCPRCLNKVEGKDESSDAPASAAAPPAAKSSNGAVYTIEAPVRCPQCDKEIRTFRVLRVLRTQVSFTSTLPRKGYVVICPECEQLLSAELSGLV